MEQTYEGHINIFLFLFFLRFYNSSSLCLTLFCSAFRLVDIIKAISDSRFESIFCIFDG